MSETVIKLRTRSDSFSNTPGKAFEYPGGYRFISDRNCRNYDWLVVYDEIATAEELSCPPERTILMTCEPTSIKCYTRRYAAQFGHLLTNRPPEAERHPHYHLGRGYYAWFIGRTYDECRNMVLPPKTKLISAVCSSKRMRHTRHYERFELLRHLAEAIPEMEWYGHGVRSFGYKFEVMDDYRYHVAVENHIANHHWSEKLTDTFLAGCLPFYAGAPDLADDFPAESFIPIPINDPKAAAEIVRESIAHGEYERRRDAVMEARRLVIERYNPWAQIISVIESAAADEASSRGGMVYPRKALRWKEPSAALEEGSWRLMRWLKFICGRAVARTNP